MLEDVYRRPDDHGLTSSSASSTSGAAIAPKSLREEADIWSGTNSEARFNRFGDHPTRAASQSTRPPMILEVARTMGDGDAPTLSTGSYTHRTLPTNRSV